MTMELGAVSYYAFAPKNDKGSLEASNRALMRNWTGFLEGSTGVTKSVLLSGEIWTWFAPEIVGVASDIPVVFYVIVQACLHIH
jgi:hydrogenase-4 membrane subunit HyfE